MTTMATTARDEPITDLDRRFSTPDAEPTPWSTGRQQLSDAELYWLSTVREDGGPHVTPMVARWFEDALVFCTGPDEQKAKNLEHNVHCVVTTGRNELEGIDVVIEGEAERITDRPTLQRAADAYDAKYGEPFQFTVGQDAFISDGGGAAFVFAIRPRKAFGFDKGESFGQTRWRF